MNKDGIFKRDPLPYTEKLFEDCVFDFETAFKLAEQIERIGVLFFVKPDLINDEKTRFNFGVKIDHLLPEDLEYLRKLAEIKISEIKV